MYRRIVGILVGLLHCIVVVPRLQAAEGSYRIESVEIHAYIAPNGDMQVSELDTYRFDGSFNGILVDLDSAGSDGIEEFMASAVTPEGARPLRVEESTDKSKHSFKIFEPSTDERKQFKLTYRARNVVQLYSDTAELYWKFFDQSNESEIESVNLYLHLPAAVDRTQLLAYGHGALSGSVTILDDGVVQYTVQPLLAREMLEARLLFPTSLVPQSTKLRNEPGLERIRAEEGRWADEADRRRELAAQQNRQLLLMGAGALAANLLLLALLYLRYGKAHRSDWQGSYYRELPGEITPAVMSYLVGYKVRPRDLMATLLDLVRRRYVTMRVVESEGGWFKGKQRDHLFKLIDRDREGLSSHERLLVQWLFDGLGPEEELSLQALQLAAKQRATAQAFVNQYNAWSKQAVAKARAEPWFEKNAGPKLAVILSGLQILPALFLAPEEWKFLAICALPLLFLGMMLKRRSRAGETEYRKWIAFKRYLEDYSRLAERDPLAVHLWEQYLVYAISLGVAKRVIAISHLDLREADAGRYYLHHSIYHHRLHEDGFDHFTESFDRTLSTASKSLPASRGSGGGFSSGGGGGGGGGGRGAF